MLKNPYVRIAIAAAVAVYVVPPINNMFVKPTLDAAPMQEVVQDVELAGIFGFVTAAVYTVLSMALGAPAAPVVP